MFELPRISSVEEVEGLHGKPVPVAVFAFMVNRNRKTVYRRIERGTLPACYLGGLLCVLVNGEHASKDENGTHVSDGPQLGASPAS